MSDIELVIKVPEGIMEYIKNNGCLPVCYIDEVAKAIENGTPLPKGHGRLIDISKLDEDRIESSNPVISFNINGEYIEAVSLNYLNNLSTIIEADKAESEEI